MRTWHQVVLNCSTVTVPRMVSGFDAWFFLLLWYCVLCSAFHNPWTVRIARRATCPPGPQAQPHAAACSPQCDGTGERNWHFRKVRPLCVLSSTQLLCCVVRCVRGHVHRDSPPRTVYRRCLLNGIPVDDVQNACSYVLMSRGGAFWVGRFGTPATFFKITANA